MVIQRILLLALGFVALYNLLFYNHIFGLALGFFFLTLNLFFFSVKNPDSRNLTLGHISAALSVLFAFLFAFRANEIVLALNLIFASSCSLLALYFYKLPSEFSYKVPNFIFVPMIMLGETVGGLLRFIKGGVFDNSLDKDTWGYILRGLLITLPVLALLFFLLGRADPIFAKLTGEILKDGGGRLVASFIIFLALIGFAFVKVIERLRVEEEAAPSGKYHEIGVIAGSVIILFSAFILVQFRYLFSTVGERELGELGITSLTYSEYVRRGFFELLGASVISSAVVLYILRFLHKLGGGQKQLIQAFSAVLTVETGLLLLSAAKRLSLYVDAHGLTRARIFGFIFLVWLAALLIILLIRILQRLRAREIFYISLAPAVAALVLVNVVNVDGLVATQYKPIVNNEIDYFYIASLSEDAYQGWEEALEDSARIIESLEGKKQFTTEDSRKLFWARNTLFHLDNHIRYLLEKYDERWKWQEYNLAEHEAYRHIKSQSDFEKKVSELLVRANALNNRIPPHIRQSTPLDRSTNPPLVR